MPSQNEACLALLLQHPITSSEHSILLIGRPVPGHYSSDQNQDLLLMGKRCRLNLHQTVASIVVAQDVSGADSTWEKWHGERGMAVRAGTLQRGTCCA